jgi:hypothetical protein
MLPFLFTLALGAALHLQAAPAPGPPITRFGGHLEHAPAGDTVRLFVGERQVKAPLSPSGDFQFEFNDLQATTPVHFTYAGQNTRLYLMPGDQLRLTLDFKDFDKSLVYSGRGSDVNNYLAQSQWKFEYSPPGDDLRPMDQLKQKPTITPAEMRRNADAFRPTWPSMPRRTRCRPPSATMPRLVSTWPGARSCSATWRLAEPKTSRRRGLISP